VHDYSEESRGIGLTATWIHSHVKTILKKRSLDNTGIQQHN